MKKAVAYFLSGIIAVSLMVSSFITVQAEESNPTLQSNIISETTEYFSDGSSAITIVVDETNTMTRATSYTKTGSKYYICRNKDGVELWRFTVHGTFSVNSGVSSTCTSASHTPKISESAWQNQSASSYKSGNQAIGDATFIKKLLFITTETRNCHVVLSCDANGNLS